MRGHVYTHTHTYTHTRVRARTNVHTRTHTHVRVRTHTHTQCRRTHPIQRVQPLSEAVPGQLLQLEEAGGVAEGVVEAVEG